MKLFQADDVERRRRFTILTVGHIFRNPLLSGLLVIHGRMAFPVLFVFLGSGCASTSAAHRPLSDAAVAEVNELIEGRRAGVVLAEEPERAVERERAAQAAVQEACLSAPGQGSVRFGEKCDDTRDCECGLTCQVDRCLGSSLNSRAIASLTAPKPLEAKEVMVGRDTTQWLELSGTGGEWLQSTVPTAALKSISVRRRGRGALEGLVLGLVLGVTTGAAVGGLWGAVAESRVSPECGCPFTALGLIYGAAFGAILGPLVGTAIGAGIGHRTTIEFNPP